MEEGFKVRALTMAETLFFVAANILGINIPVGRIVHFFVFRRCAEAPRFKLSVPIFPPAFARKHEEHKHAEDRHAEQAANTVVRQHPQRAGHHPGQRSPLVDRRAHAQEILNHFILLIKTAAGLTDLFLSVNPARRAVAPCSFVF
ncbi:hypothetical protein BN873_p70015 [Candidatus Competibacter denitrificans Run_A_D11]|uniref:Uncharacterized protein n=1 Tax=Candidatus Competibacter denitrificans Run_A_D11 TaxID=1400863 RepID=W6MAI7_9GAMM|nr:hypothetical protein BN873_p70015 [Candidatus Competibacter denitrificans Run_A_D11]